MGLGRRGSARGRDINTDERVREERGGPTFGALEGARARGKGKKEADGVGQLERASARGERASKSKSERDWAMRGRRSVRKTGAWLCSVTFYLSLSLSVSRLADSAILFLLLSCSCSSQSLLLSLKCATPKRETVSVRSVILLRYLLRHTKLHGRPGPDDRASIWASLPPPSHKHFRNRRPLFFRSCSKDRTGFAVPIGKSSRQGLSHTRQPTFDSASRPLRCQPRAQSANPCPAPIRFLPSAITLYSERGLFAGQKAMLTCLH
jgi:hypothetical protein